MTPSTGISKGNYIYLILIALIILTTYYSFKKSLSQTASTQPGQGKSMLIMMLVMIAIASFSLPTAIALYWISTNAFIIAQTVIIEKTMNKKDNKKGNKNEKNKISIKEKAEKRRGN
jgi:YidC/Oxa1 family membrane protein insertase